MDDGAFDGGNLVLGKGDMGTEGFGFDGEVHHGGGGSGWVSFVDGLEGFEVALAVGDHVQDSLADEVDAGVGHDGDGEAVVAGQYGLNPIVDVDGHGGDGLVGQ